MSFLMFSYLGLIENVNHLPYKSLPSDSHYQRKSQSEEKSGSRKKQKKKKFTLEIPEYLNYNKNKTESEEVGSETEAKKHPLKDSKSKLKPNIKLKPKLKNHPLKDQKSKLKLNMKPN